MVILLFGPPGSGKGTQSRLLSQWLGIPSISTGDLLRAEAESDTPPGRELARLLKAGQLAGDGLVNQIVARSLDSLNGSGVILDGYPRTPQQAVFLEDVLHKRGQAAPVVIHLRVPNEVLVQRLATRRQCPSCGRGYNLNEHRPTRDGLCDDCGASLIARDDDEAGVIVRRLADHHSRTEAVLQHYAKGNYYLLDGDRPTAEVFAEIRAIVESELASDANQPH